MRGNEKYDKVEQQPQSNYHKFQGHLSCQLVSVDNHLTFMNEQNTSKNGKSSCKTNLNTK